MKLLARGFWDGALNRVLGRFGFIKIPSGLGGTTTGGIFGFTSLGSRRKQLESFQNHVYKCVTVISNRAVGVPMRLFKERGDKDEEIKRHPFIDLMKKPNPYMTGRILKAVTFMQLDLAGMAFWVKVFNGLGRPAELWPLPVGLFTEFVFNDEKTELLGYEFRTDTGRPVRYAPEEIVYFRKPHPVYFFEGASPIQAMAFAYDTDKALRTYQRNFFQNSARPDVVLETDQNMSSEDAKRVLLEWVQNHQGQDKSWLPTVLFNGLKANAFSHTARDFEFAKLADWNKEDIFEAYQVPEGMLGTVKDVNRANQIGVEISFNSVCIKPRLDLYEEPITNDVLSHYDTGLYVEHDNCVPRDRELDLKERESNLEHKLTVINEERAKMGKEPVAWGHAPWVSIQEIQYGEEPGIRREGAGASLRDLRGGPSDLEGIDPQAKRSSSEALRLSHERRVAARSRAYRARLRKFFKAQRHEVLDNLEERYPRIEGAIAGMSVKKAAKWLKEHKDLVDSISFDLNQANKDLINGSGPYLEAALIDGGEVALARVGAVDVIFDILSPQAASFLKEKEIILRDVNRVTYDAIRAQLVEGFEAGETMQQMAARIRKVFDSADRVRSLRIAQTEINSAANFGSFEGYRQSGVVEKKEWLAGPGARETHQAAASRYSGDGAIPLHEDFLVGAGRGPAPGNIGLAGEDINCRCTILPVVRQG